MDALEILKQDHQKVKDLFEQAADADGTQLQRICRQIKTELETHAHIEETVFYPAMEKFDQLKEMVQESRSDHDEIKTLLGELDAIGGNGEGLAAKLEELMDAVESHAEDQEEGELFPQVLEVVDRQELERLGSELQTAKGENQPQSKAV